MSETGVICHVTCSDGTEYPLHACVKGKLIEVNERLLKNPQLLVDKVRRPSIALSVRYQSHTCRCPFNKRFIFLELSAQYQFHFVYSELLEELWYNQCKSSFIVCCKTALTLQMYHCIDTTNFVLKILSIAANLDTTETFYAADLYRGSSLTRRTLI